ncbi:MAG: hypothetical protein ACPG6U_13625, partial [Paracoccaceae bacterium]
MGSLSKDGSALCLARGFLIDAETKQRREKYLWDVPKFESRTIFQKNPELKEKNRRQMQHDRPTKFSFNMTIA